MPMIEKNQLGSINISENVLAVLVGAAVENCAGLVGMASGKMMDGINELLRRENYGRGAKVTVENDAVSIQVRVIVEYGVSIPAMAQSAIDMVKYTITQYTGMPVERVEVVVQGVRV